MILKSKRTQRFPFLHSPCLCASVAWSPFFSSLLGLILFVADLFHPFDSLAVKVFQDGDVRHGSGWRRAVPMLLTRRTPDHIARSNFFFWTAFALNPSTP